MRTGRVRQIKILEIAERVARHLEQFEATATDVQISDAQADRIIAILAGHDPDGARHAPPEIHRDKLGHKVDLG